MQSADAIRARTLGVAMVLILLATSLFFYARPAARGGDKPSARTLPAELA